MEILKITEISRKAVNTFIQEQWFSLQMVVHGEIIDLSIADGYYITEQEKIIGLITHKILNGTMEILSLDSLCENQGMGTALLNKAISEAKQKGCNRVTLITTNDNTRALRFYQKRGFDIVCLYRNALENSRKLKPEIPLLGIDQIPLKHEIELDMIL